MEKWTKRRRCVMLTVRAVGSLSVSNVSDQLVVGEVHVASQVARSSNPGFPISLLENKIECGCVAST